MPHSNRILPDHMYTVMLALGSVLCVSMEMTHSLIADNHHWYHGVVVFLPDYFAPQLLDMHPAGLRVDGKHEKKGISLSHGGIPEEHEFFLTGRIDHLYIMVVESILYFCDVTLLWMMMVRGRGGGRIRLLQ